MIPEKELQALLRKWRDEGADQRSIALRVRGIEAACATTHANVKEAGANELSRLMNLHSGTAAEPKTGAKR